MTSASELTRARALDPADWRAMEEAHHAKVDAALAGRTERSRRGVKHPVEDFLFTYYSLRPAQLRRWHPGVGVVLLGSEAELAERAGWRDHTWVGEPGHAPDSGTVGVALDVQAFVLRRGQALRRSVELLRASADRPAHLGCFGLHEWAMVYRLPEGAQRHEDWPLRLGQAGTDDVVHAHRIRCSHFDAFRFFTSEAAPRNALQPTRDTQIALEQPGCLHATMDLYKWAYKLLPAVPSSMVLDCFMLAREVRELDMRASPYDLSALGYQPVRIETPEGKAEYMASQRAFVERAAPLRNRLIRYCERALA